MRTTALTVIMLCVITGCRDKAREVPGNSNLVEYSIQTDGGKGIMTGVKDKTTGREIVPPGNYTSIAADGNTVCCTSPDNMKHVYFTDGKLFGRFEMFNHWTTPPGEGDYFIGVSYNSTSFYFPKTGNVVKTKERFLADADRLFVRTAGGVEMRDFDGRLLLTATDSIYIIKNGEHAAGRQIVAIDGHGDSSTPTLYSKDGEKLKSITTAQWRQMKAGMRHAATDNGGRHGSIRCMVAAGTE